MHTSKNHPFLTAILTSILLGFFALIPPCLVGQEWQTLKGCRLVDDNSNDADSFRVKHKESDFTFCLYFVDAPEKENQNPSHIASQAAAFGVSKLAVLRGGRNASAFARRLLKEPFEVFTRFENAQSTSGRPTQYAVIRPAEASGKDLAELLVEAGWARPNGNKHHIPGTPDKHEFQHLEAQARREQRGVFGGKKSIEQTRDAKADDPSNPEISTLIETVSQRTTFTENPSSEPLAGEGNDAVQTWKSLSSRDSEGAASQAAGKIDINTATLEELISLPRIGDKTANAIISLRPFSKLEDLERVPNIGPATIEQLRGLIIVR